MYWRKLLKEVEMIKVRKAEINDAESISHLCSELGYPSGSDTISNRLELIKRDPGHCVFVAIHDKTIVGWIHAMIVLHLESDSFVEIGGMVVSHSFRDRGIGKMLVEEIREWASVNNTGSIRVGCQTKRLDAHQFYETIGFTSLKVQTIFELTPEDS